MSASEMIGEGVVEARLSTDRLKRDVADVERSMSRSFQDVGKKMQTTGKALMRNVTAPIVGLGVAILKSAGDFESSMNQVRAVTGATGETFDNLRGLAMELGRTTQFSASQAADAMYFLASAGFDTQQVMEALPGVLNLAAAANMDLGRAADIASNILSAFGLEASELGRVNDTLVATFQKTNTNVEQLGDAFRFAAPVAAGLGVEIEEVSAALGLMGNAGIQAGMAGTSLRMAMTQLVQETGPAASIMERLGVNATDAEGNLRPLDEIVRQLEQSGASTSDMMELFGQRAGPAMVALVSQGSDALRDLAQDLRDSGGIAEQVAGIQMEGLNGALFRLKSAAEGAAIAIGDSGLLEDATAFTETVAEWFQRLAETNPELLNLGIILGGVAAAVGPATWAIGGMVGGFGKLIAAINPVTLALGAAVIATGIFVHAKMEARERIEEYRRTLDEATGALTELTRAEAVNRLESDGLIDNVRTLGLNMEDVVDAMLGSEEAFDRVRNHAVALREEAGAGSDAQIIYNKAWNELRETLKDSSEALSEAVDMQRLASEAAAEAEGRFVDEAHAAETLGSAAAYMGDHHFTARDGMDAAAEGAGILGGDLDVLGGEFEGLEDDIEQATNALRAHADEIRAQNDPLFALHRALGDVESAQDAFNEAVAEHGPNSREARDASVRLADSAFGLAGAAGDASGVFTGKLDPAMRDIMRSAGFTEEQIDAVESSFREAAAAGAAFEDDYQARVGLSNDRWTIQRLNLISQIADRTARDRSFRVTPFLDASSYNRALGRIQTGGPLADGGTAHRGRLHLVGEEGPEFFVPGVTGTVVDAERTARLMMGGPNLDLGTTTSRLPSAPSESPAASGQPPKIDMHVQAWSDRFSLSQVMDELAMHGAV